MMNAEPNIGNPAQHKEEAPESAPLPGQYRTPVIVIALCCTGPLALPLVWKRPKTSLTWKIVVTVSVLLITALLCWALYLAIVLLIHMVQDFRQLMEEL